MINTLLTALGSLAERRGAQTAQQAADTQASQELYKTAKSAAETGDWQWITDNQDALQRHIHPDLLRSIVSTTTRQNARLHDAETAEGGRATIPLSPRNIYERGSLAATQGTIPTYDQRTPRPQLGAPDPTSAILQAANEGGQGPSFSGLQGIPNDEVFNPNSYGGMRPSPSGPPPTAFLDRNNPIDQPRGADAPSLGGEIDQPAALNQQFQGALDAAPGGQPQPAAAPPAPAGPPALQVPPNRQPVNQSRTVQTAIGNRTITKNIPGTTGKEVLASLISQGEQQGMHPDAILKAFNDENVRRLQAGEPALDLDEGAYNAARVRHWEQLRAQIQTSLSQQGVDPQVAFAESAKMAYQQSRFVPPQWFDVVKPDAQELAGHGYQLAVEQAGSQLSSVLTGSKVPLKTMRPTDVINSVFSQPFLLKAVDSTPLPSPERTRVLHELSNTAHSAFLSAIQQARPDLTPPQQNYYAMSLASKATGGNVPEQWRAFVEQDLTQLGLVSPADLMVYQGMPLHTRPDILDADFGPRIQAARVHIEMDKGRREAYYRAANDPESIAQVHRMLTGGSPAQPGAPAAAQLGQPQPAAADPRAGGPAPASGGPITPATIGQGQRNRELAQAGRKEQQSKDIERKNAILPSTERQKLQSQDQLYQRAITSMHLAKKKGPDGQSLLEKYGSEPGTFFSWSARASAELGRQDPQLAKYLQSISSFYNMQRHALSGAAVSPYEGKSLKPDLPGPDDNVRTGLMKLSNIAKQLGTFMAQDIKQLRKDYPASDYDSYFYSRLESKRAERKKKRSKPKGD